MVIDRTVRWTHVEIKFENMSLKWMKFIINDLDRHHLAPTGYHAFRIALDIYQQPSQVHV